MMYFWIFVAYVLGTAVGFFFGRKIGIEVGSVMTFDLLVKLGYVNYEIGNDGEISVLKIDNNSKR
jgi:hypothetical protein